MSLPTRHYKMRVMCVFERATSRVPGNGLFLRACPPRRQAAGEDSDTSQDVTVKGNSHLCVYSNERITREEYTCLPNTDYLMECSHGIFTQQVYDGKNIGRFVNHRGFIPAFKTMVRISSRHRYPQGIKMWRLLLIVSVTSVTATVRELVSTSS